MEAALVCYTLLNLAILGFIVLFVRASRARAVSPRRWWHMAKKYRS